MSTGQPGKTVYKGQFNVSFKGLSAMYIPVAVKRILRERSGFQIEVVEREMTILTQLESHPNVVRYVGHADDQDFYYIATELCDFSLEDYVAGVESQNKNIPKRPPLRDSLDPPLRLDQKEILLQCYLGVQFLHYKKFVHREIKPQNYLISRSDKADTVKLSDFGITKEIRDGKFKIYIF